MPALLTTAVTLSISRFSAFSKAPALPPVGSMPAAVSCFLASGVLTAAIASAVILSTIGCGRPGRPYRPDDGRQIVARNDLGDRRNVRRLKPTAGAVVGEQLDLLALDRADQRRIGREQHLHVSAQQRRHRLPGAAIGNVSHFKLQRRLQRLHRQMMDAADAGRAVVDLARMRLHVVDELAQGRHRQVRMRREKQRRAAKQRQRNDVLRIVAELLEQRRIGRDDAAVGDDEGVAVGRAPISADHRGSRAAAGAVLDHHGLADPLLQVLGGDARDRVRQAARRIGHDEADRPGSDMAPGPRAATQDASANAARRVIGVHRSEFLVAPIPTGNRAPVASGRCRSSACRLVSTDTTHARASPSRESAGAEPTQ